MSHDRPSNATFSDIFGHSSAKPEDLTARGEAAVIALARISSTPETELIQAAFAQLKERAESAESRIRIEDEAWLEECRASIRRRETYLAEHDARPSRYLGRPQPGASPTFYGPDDVVVDGDWLARLEEEISLLRNERETSEQALAARTTAVVSRVSRFLRWLGDARGEYSHESFQNDMRTARHLADMVEGTNDGKDWTPPWLWDEYEEQVRVVDPQRGADVSR